MPNGVTIITLTMLFAMNESGNYNSNLNIMLTVRSLTDIETEKVTKLVSLAHLVAMSVHAC